MMLDKLFRTSKEGSYDLGPDDIQVEDVIVILNGGSIPHIL